MEDLQYIIDDNTIVELLGLQSFTTKESAILELVKNAYDAGAKLLKIKICADSIEISDNGNGMSKEEFKNNWLHIGKSTKGYSFKDTDGKIRIAAGAKGVGRFALARLGALVIMKSKKDNCDGIKWTTDWTNENNKLSDDNSKKSKGTVFDIQYSRDAWNIKQAKNLADYLGRTYFDNSMEIQLSFCEEQIPIEKCFSNLQLGKNYITSINLKFNAKKTTLITTIESDEFDEAVSNYYKEESIHKVSFTKDMSAEFETSSEPYEKNKELLQKLGDFSADFYFGMDKNLSEDKEKFLYKYDSLSNRIKKGIILYRNAFSISSYEGYKDWLQLGKRSRASPASPSHPTGSWRVRENQISGKVHIDKEKNKVLQDLVNRQGLVENDYYNYFIRIIESSISDFEHYRQSIIRAVNKKNKEEPVKEEKRISDELINKTRQIDTLSDKDKEQLISELQNYKKHEEEHFKSEERYRYDVRILNILATSGLKASSIAHELNNDRNQISDNYEFIVDALKKYNYWDDLNSYEKTQKSYLNVPDLLLKNKEVNTKFLQFVDTLLTEVEKKQFYPQIYNIKKLMEKIKERWSSQYSWVSINLTIQPEELEYKTAEDIFNVIFDNLILNSIQQNESKDHLIISIDISLNEENLLVKYDDNGCGLPQKYRSNPNRILDPLETSRENGHGLGMWIINNTLDMTSGNVIEILPKDGFSIKFIIGDKI